MDIGNTIAGVRDALTVQRVYGDPYEKDGVTVIPVARVRGGGGGGDDGGGDSARSPAGGLGFGMAADPVGAYVIRNGDVRWEPVVDLSRIAVLAQFVTVVALLVFRGVSKRRHERKLAELGPA